LKNKNGARPSGAAAGKSRAARTSPTRATTIQGSGFVAWPWNVVVAAPGKGVCVFPMGPWAPQNDGKTRTNIDEASIFSGGSHFSQTNSNGHQLSERN